MGKNLLLIHHCVLQKILPVSAEFLRADSVTWSCMCLPARAEDSPAWTFMCAVPCFTLHSLDDSSRAANETLWEAAAGFGERTGREKVLYFLSPWS